MRVFPDSSILLVDTYDTLEGTRRAIKAAGEKLKAVRLDSGDLAVARAGEQRVPGVAEKIGTLEPIGGGKGL